MRSRFERDLAEHDMLCHAWRVCSIASCLCVLRVVPLLGWNVVECKNICNAKSDRSEGRTQDLLLRKQTLYPLS